ncbi:hypothetical protein QZH41_002339 [Actinostola sp. cb2023]|nr:hypothetical protein QZH41_002339 [Actinostola sp. cb2023]
MKRKRSELERRVAMTIGIVIIIFTISWLPIIVLRSVRASSNSGTAYNWARTFSLCNSAINPWIYCYRIPEFRGAYRRLVILRHWGKVKGRSETIVGSESAMHPVLKSKESQSETYGNSASYHQMSTNLNADDGKIESQKQAFKPDDDDEIESESTTQLVLKPKESQSETYENSASCQQVSTNLNADDVKIESQKQAFKPDDDDGIESESAMHPVLKPKESQSETYGNSASCQQVSTNFNADDQKMESQKQAFKPDDDDDDIESESATLPKESNSVSNGNWSIEKISTGPNDDGKVASNDEVWTKPTEVPKAGCHSGCNAKLEPNADCDVLVNFEA